MTIASPIFSISNLLSNIANIADLPPDLYAIAEAEYKEIGLHLANTQGDGWDVYPQGSMAIGTVVRPIGNAGFDLDMVCLRNVAKQSTTQLALKEEVGAVLMNYVRRDDTKPSLVTPSRRCWVVGYPEHGPNADLHIDVLPAIPALDLPSSTAIEITDKELRFWQPSDPKAYAKWFNECTLKQRMIAKEALAIKLGKSIGEIPDWEVKSTLQRVVQVLKLHRDHYFQGRDSELRPPSILITTLAAYAYGGELDLRDAVLVCGRDMPHHIEQTDGVFVVKSPVSKENFADKWAAYPERRAAFFSWMEAVQHDIEEASAAEGMDRVKGQLAKSFGESRVVMAARNMGVELHQMGNAGELSFDARAGGLVAAAAMAKAVPSHTFFGTKDS